MNNADTDRTKIVTDMIDDPDLWELDRTIGFPSVSHKVCSCGPGDIEIQGASSGKTSLYIAQCPRCLVVYWCHQ